MNDWQTAIAAGAAAVTGLVMAGRSAVNAYAEMDAEMANVRKFTGMTAEQVKQLNQEFLKIDTRTSREDLNKLAQEAGRLGKTSQEDVLGFVKAADQINVALDDLGEGATLTLSKLTNIFGDEERLGTEQSLLAVGSVINELSQNCTASAPYLAQFSQRLAGVGAQAGMTIPQLMAFAAVLDSQGQAVEMSATALSKLIMDLFKETDKIAKATGLDLEKFKETLNRSTNEGLLILLDRLKQLGGMDVLAPVFKDMGEEGARASAVISALAGNVDTVRWQQEEANKAFQEATSITKEFTVQNTTVQAGLDKARKRLTELAVELGEKLAPVMKHVISSTTLILKLMSSVITFVGKYKGELIVLTASIVAYTVAVNAAAIKTKAFAVWQGVCKVAAVAWTAVTYLSATAMALLSGRITRATIAFKAFSTTLKLSPVGLIVSAVTALAVGLYTLAKRTSDTAEAQKTLDNIRKEAQQRMVDEKTKIDLLVSAAKNEKLSLDERKKAIDKLNGIIPNYNAQLDETTGKYVENKKALDDYLSSLAKKYEIEGAKAQLEEIGKQIADLRIQKTEADKALKAAKARAGSSSTGGGTPRPQTSGGAYAPTSYHTSIGNSGEIAGLESRVRNIENDIKTEEYKRSVITDIYGTDLQKEAINATDNNTTTTTTTTGTTPTSDTTTDKDRFKVEKEWREREEALNRIAYATGEKTYREYMERMNSIAVEFYNKQLAHTDLSENERLSIQADYYEALQKQSETNNDFTIEEENNAYNERLAQAKQFFIDGKYSTATYNEEIERIESEHLKRLVELTKEGTKERAETEKALADFEYNSALRKRQETERLQKQLKKDYFGDNATERKTDYDNDLANLKLVYEAELLATQGNADERLRIEEAYEKAKLALRKKYAIDNIDANRNALEKANAELAEWLESDAGKAVTQSFDTVMSGMSSIFAQVSSLVQAELEIQTAAIEKRYDKEISLAEGNTYKVNKIEKQKQAEIAKAKNDANRKMYAMQVIQAVAQTATNALNAYGSAAAVPVIGYILAPIAAAMAVAAGALQIATIKKQQQASEAQGYSKGGFTPQGAVDEEVGVVHAGEWVASQKLLANPVARPLINALDYAQRTNTIGSLRSADVSRSITAPIMLANSQTAPQVIVPQTPQTVVVEQNSEYATAMKKLADRLNEPFVTVNTITGDTGIKKAQDEYDRLIKNKTPKSKRK